MRKYPEFDVYRGGVLPMWIEFPDRTSLDGCTVFFTLKRSYEDTDAEAVLEKETDTGIVHTGNRADWVISEADIASIPSTDDFFKFVWEIWFRDEEGTDYQMRRGTLRVLPSINQDF